VKAKKISDATLRKQMEIGTRARNELAKRDRLRARDKALALVGTCYRRANFSGETAEWRQYAIVTGVDDDGFLSAFTFDFFGDYSLGVGYSNSPYFRDGDDCGNQWDECTRGEMIAAWGKAMAMLEKKASEALGSKMFAV